MQSRTIGLAMHSALGRIVQKCDNKFEYSALLVFLIIIASAWAEKLPATYSKDSSGVDPETLKALGTFIS